MGAGCSSQIGVPPGPTEVYFQGGSLGSSSGQSHQLKQWQTPIRLSFLHWAARSRQLFGVSASLGPRTPCRHLQTAVAVGAAARNRSRAVVQGPAQFTPDSIVNSVCSDG